MEDASPFYGSTTQSVQLPPRSIPLSTISQLPRVKPNIVGWVPADDPAYQDELWSKEEDALLARVIQETPEGLSRQWDRLAALHFPERSPRDLRMRWQTYLKPERNVRDRLTQDVSALRKKHGHQVTAFEGRWCLISSGSPTPRPHERLLDIQSQECAQDVLEPGRVHMHADQLLPRGSVRRGKTHELSGLTSFDFAVQTLFEAEKARRYRLSGRLLEKKAIAERKLAGEIIWDEVKWLPEEDVVLREGFELFGTDWTRISQGLKARRRTADECRERMEELHSDGP